MDLKSASSAAQYCFCASNSACSFFTSNSSRRISLRSFCVSADGAAARCGAGAGTRRWPPTQHAAVRKFLRTHRANLGPRRDSDTRELQARRVGGAAGGEKRPLRTREAASDEFASSSRNEPRDAPAGFKRLFTRAIRSCGWNGLRTSSSAFTAMAFSATVRFTTPGHENHRRLSE